MRNSANTKERILLARDGNEKVLSELLEENKPLVKSIALRFTDRGIDFDDLMQLGMIGLIKAIRGFDFSFDTVLSTYAVPMICGEIKKFLRDDGLIKISREVKQNAMHIRRFQNDFEQSHGRSPSIEEVVESLGLSQEDVAFALSAVQPVSPLICENEDGEDFEIQIGKDETEENIEKYALFEALEKLTKEEQSVIRMRYFKNMTQQQTAKLLGYSQVKISRMEKRICIKLKTMLE